MKSNEEIIQTQGSESTKSTRQARRKASAMVNVDLCTGCGICAKVCPAGCISVVESELNFNGVSFVDQQRCTGCNICAIDCPWCAIQMIWPDGARKEPADYAKQLQKQRGYR